MSYSCSDFTAEILDVLAGHKIIDEKIVPDDNPEAQAQIARIGINQFARQRKAMIAALRGAHQYPTAQDAIDAALKAAGVKQ